MTVHMDIHNDSHLVRRLEIVETGRRRRWSEAEKLRIVEESFSGARQASATARRHKIAVAQLFAWRKAYREGRLGDVGGLVPAQVIPDAPGSRASGNGRIEIFLESGQRVVVDGNVDPALVVEIVRGLERLA